MNKYLINTFLLLVTGLSGFAQAPGIRWSKYLGEKHAAFCIYDIKTAVDGGYIAAGVDSISTNLDKERVLNRTLGSNLHIYKLDNRGNISWDRYMGYGAFTSILALSDGNYVAAGTRLSPTYYYVVKMNPAGDTLWTRTYGGSLVERAYQIKQTADNGFIIAGFSYSNDMDVVKRHDGAEAWLLKLDPSGAKQWAITYGGNADDTAYAIHPTDDGGYIVCGTSRSGAGDDVAGNYGSADGWVFKVDAAGTVQWKRNVGGSGRDVLNNIVKNADGSYTLCGFSYSNDFDVSGNHGLADLWVMNISDAGVINWSKLYGGSGDDAATSMSAAGIQELLVTGFTESDNGNVSVHAGRADNWLLKLTSTTGNLVWEKTTGTVKNEYATSVVFLSATNITTNSFAEATDGLGFDFANAGLLINYGEANFIHGITFYDKNSNGTKDAGEEGFDNCMVITQSTGITRSAIPYKGYFNLDVDLGTYNTSVQVHKPYHTVVPSATTSVFSTYNKRDSISFAIQPIPGKQDISINLVPLSGLRPGFYIYYRMIYKNTGTVDIPSGTIKLQKNVKQSFFSATTPPAYVNDFEIGWNYTNLNIDQSDTIDLVLYSMPPPTFNIGDTLRLAAIIDPVAGDETPADDTSVLKQIVTGSYDPNDKMEANAGIITPAQLTAGDYLTYRIRFQNTGTDTAFTVVIRDTLDNRLDWSTLQMVTASHPYQLSIEGGDKLNWTFNNILLPDSIVNEPASHGFIAYRIKPLPTVPPGDTIKNTAGIYFDFNPPVATNIANTIVLSLVPLPATILSFQAAVNKTAVDVKWTTTLEHNVRHFEILRSPDGFDFKVIGKVQPGSSNYIFKDEYPLPGYNYYRLRTVDIDGAIAYSTIAIVNMSADNRIISSIYPNPGPGQLVYVKLQGIEPGKVVIEVMDGVGRKLLSRQYHNLQSGEFRTELPLGNLTRGSYLLQVTANGKVYLHKLLVQ